MSETEHLKAAFEEKATEIETTERLTRIRAGIDRSQRTDGGQMRSHREPRRSWAAPAVAIAVALAVGASFVVSLRSAPRAGEPAAADQPPRGEILASGGQGLATTGVSYSLSVNPAQVAAVAQRPAEVRLLEQIVFGTNGVRYAGTCQSDSPVPQVQLSCRIVAPVPSGGSSTPLRSTLFTAKDPGPVSASVVAALRRHASQLPGVAVARDHTRQYPFGTTAAAVLGVITTKDGTASGASGLESEYNKALSAGQNLRTSIDLALQRAGERALAHSIGLVPSATGGAFVAMDPQNGAVYAMGSAPAYNPEMLTKPMSQSEYSRAFGAGADDPLLNRAIQGLGPDGSTFKVITATAALQSGKWSTDQTYDDTGKFCPTPTLQSDCRQNSGGAAYGVVNMVTAIRVSDDVFFYDLGDKLNADPVTEPDGGALQTWARAFGIGRRTGIDLPDESIGTLPTPKRIAAKVQQEKECDNATGPFAYVSSDGTAISSKLLPGYHRAPTHAPGGCGIAIPGTTWTVGDNINAAVGQGDVQVTPLQLALVYSALANGGKVVTPHIGDDIEGANNAVVQKIDPGPARNLHISPSTIATLQAGLRAAASTGTSGDVMGDFNKPVYGKTGTAQYIPTYGPYKGTETDSAWYACFVPASATSRPIVIVVWVQGGGFGDVSAAPVARQILSQWFDSRPGPFKAGNSQDQ